LDSTASKRCSIIRRIEMPCPDPGDAGAAVGTCDPVGRDHGNKPQTCREFRPDRGKPFWNFGAQILLNGLFSGGSIDPIRRSM
jgi:hypothetical protein